jgi:hypothetical protein
VGEWVLGIKKLMTMKRDHAKVQVHAGVGLTLARLAGQIQELWPIAPGRKSRARGAGFGAFLTGNTFYSYKCALSS